MVISFCRDASARRESAMKVEGGGGGGGGGGLWKCEVRCRCSICMKLS